MKEYLQNYLIHGEFVKDIMLLAIGAVSSSIFQWVKKWIKESKTKELIDSQCKQFDNAGIISLANAVPHIKPANMILRYIEKDENRCIFVDGGGKTGPDTKSEKVFG